MPENVCNDKVDVKTSNPELIDADELAYSISRHHRWYAGMNISANLSGERLTYFDSLSEYLIREKNSWLNDES